MTIERRHVGKRLSDLVIYAPRRRAGSSTSPDRSPTIARPTSPARRSQVLAQIDRLLAEAGSDKTQHPVGDDLPRRHGRLRRR